MLPLAHILYDKSSSKMSDLFYCANGQVTNQKEMLNKWTEKHKIDGGRFLSFQLVGVWFRWVCMALVVRLGLGFIQAVLNKFLLEPTGSAYKMCSALNFSFITVKQMVAAF